MKPLIFQFLPLFLIFDKIQRWERLLRLQKHIKRSSRFKKDLDFGLRKLKDRQKQKALNLPLYEKRHEEGLKEFQQLYGRDYWEPLPKSRKDLTPLPNHPNYKTWLAFKAKQNQENEPTEEKMS